jgi:hypothetical protein
MGHVWSWPKCCISQRPSDKLVRPGRTNVRCIFIKRFVRIWLTQLWLISKLETLESRFCSSSPVSSRWDPAFQFTSRRRKKPMLEGHWAGGILSHLREGQHFCSTQAVNWLDKAHLHWGGQSALLGLLIQMLISPKHSHRNPRIMFDQISGHLMV